MNTAAAPNSNQVAQRNIEIGGSCGWTLTNGAQSSQFGVVFTATTSTAQSYVLQTGDSATVSFDDNLGIATFFSNGGGIVGARPTGPRARAPHKARCPEIESP